jgi:hypothetical protein
MVHPYFIGHVTNFQDQVGGGQYGFKLPAQIKFQIEQGRLGLIQQNNRMRFMADHLPDQFAPDGAGGSGNEHHLIAHLFAGNRIDDLNRSPAQQILNPNVPNLRGF